MTSPIDPNEMLGAAVEVDSAALEAVLPFRKSAPIRALSTFSELGDQPPMLAISGAVLALGLLRRDPRMTRAGGRMIVSHLLATGAKDFVKHRVDRKRPNAIAAKGGSAMPQLGDSRDKEDTSFPSGHSAGAMAVARAFGREYPEYQAAAIAAAGVIAVAQIPRCAHYPTDVGAGLAIGLVAEAGVDAALRRIEA